MIAKIKQFVQTDIWRIRAKELTRGKARWIRLLRVGILSVRGFNEDKCSFRASALTFYSLLSIVPFLAMALGVAKGFGIEMSLEKQLFARFQGQEEVLVKVMEFARSFLETARGGVITGVGVFLLFWATIRVLGNIEDSFNYIWEIPKPRTFARKIGDYLSAMLICPLLLIVSGAITVMIKSQVEFAVQKIPIIGAISPAIFFTLRLAPYFVIWVLFTFIYLFMPNMKINLKSGIFAGVVAGTLYQLFQWAYLSFQIGVAKYNAIYGSFAALPLFVVWLQISWMVVLFGAEIAFAHQNEGTYEFEPDCSAVSYAFKRLLTLRIAHLLIKNFSQGCNPLTAAQVSSRLEIPMRLVRKMLDELVGSKIISGVCSSDSRDAGYQPARNIDLLTIKYVIDSLEQRGSDNIPIAGPEELERLSECLKAFGEVVEKSPANMLLKDI